MRQIHKSIKKMVAIILSTLFNGFLDYCEDCYCILDVSYIEGMDISRLDNKTPMICNKCFEKRDSL